RRRPRAAARRRARRRSVRDGPRSCSAALLVARAGLRIGGHAPGAAPAPCRRCGDAARDDGGAAYGDGDECSDGYARRLLGTGGLAVVAVLLGALRRGSALGEGGGAIGGDDEAECAVDRVAVARDDAPC